MASATILQSSFDNSLPPSEGPLAVLYKDPNNSQRLRYPSNLGDSRHQHIVLFTAKINTPSDYDQKKD